MARRVGNHLTLSTVNKPETSLNVTPFFQGKFKKAIELLQDRKENNSNSSSSQPVIHFKYIFNPGV